MATADPNRNFGTARIIDRKARGQGGRFYSPSSSSGSTRGSPSACTALNYPGFPVRQMLGSSPSMTLRERFQPHAKAHPDGYGIKARPRRLRDLDWRFSHRGY
jgi:hypothetical protein